MNSPGIDSLEDPSDYPSVYTKYFNTEDFKTLILDQQFSIFLVNIRSCRRNFSILESFLALNSGRFDIIALTETWLSADIDVTFDMMDYDKLNLYRGSHGGGVSIYVKKAHNAKILEELTFLSGDMEVLSIMIDYCKMNISCIYRPPSSPIPGFNNTLLNSLLPFMSDKNHILIGDLNINIIICLLYTSDAADE